jgi:hypothetical protein
VCLWRLWSVSPSSPWLDFHGVHSPTAPAAPSLRPLLPNSSLIRCSLSWIFTITFLRLVRPKVPRVFNAPKFMTLRLLVTSSFVSEGTDSPKHSDAHFPQSNEVPAFRLFSSRSPAQWFSWRSCRMSSRSSDIHVVASLSHGSLFQRRFPVASDAFSGSFVLSRFLLRHCPWSEFSVVSVRPSVLCDCALYAMPLMHCRSSIWGWRPTSSGTYHCRGCFFCVLWLNTGPHIGPLVLR